MKDLVDVRSEISTLTSSITGVCPVLEVPFDSDEGVDYDGVATVARELCRAGVSAIMFPGFASEFYKLSELEIRSVLKVLIDVSHGRVGIIASVASHSTRLASRAAASAIELGATAINILPPYLLGPSREQVREHLRAVGEAVAGYPLIVQHAPVQTASGLAAADFRAIAAERNGELLVKVESIPPGRFIAQLIEPSMDLPPVGSIVGYAGLQLPDALTRGAVAVQPGSSFVEIYLDIWGLWNDGKCESARKLHAKLVPYLSNWMQAVELVIAVEKEISVRRGWFSNATVRAPGWVLDAHELEVIDRFLADFPALISTERSAGI